MTFLGLTIWKSDEDEREYSEEIDDFEPLQGFLMKKIKEILNLISSIELFKDSEDMDHAD